MKGATVLVFDFTLPKPKISWTQADISYREVGPRREGLPGFPPHDPDYPDVDPETGDERETTP